MKCFTILSVLALFACANGATAGVLYNDATGDVIVPGSPFPHLDIASVDVSNTATDLVFKINLVGDPVATDWGKYMVGIDSAPGGDPVGDGWGRPIGMATGMDFWLGGWADGGSGLELRNWNGSAWGLQAASYNAVPPLATPTKTSSSYSVSVPLSYLGLGVGSSFLFDVYTSGGGGGDSAVDALGNPAPSISDWGNPYNSGGNVQSYTVIPEPGTLTLLGLCVVFATFGRATKRSRSV